MAVVRISAVVRRPIRNSYLDATLANPSKALSKGNRCRRTQITLKWRPTLPVIR